MEQKAGKATVHLLTQDFAFDAANKNRMDGPYQQRQEVTIPADLTPQNKWFMFEGPVLENDKVAYRYYADSRHRFDVYGKTVADIVMDTVSWKYHDIMNWGSDILKVGNSLGIGSPGIYYQDTVYTFSDYERKQLRIVDEGNGAAVLQTDFTGLRIGEHQFDLTHLWRLLPGRYDAEVELTVKDGELPEGAHFVTGIVKHLPEATSGTVHGHTYVMNWGKQSYHKELMGMAVLADAAYGPQAADDALSHLLIMTNAPATVKYRMLSVWERDQSQTKDAAGFQQMVADAAQ